MLLSRIYLRCLLSIPETSLSIPTKVCRVYVKQILKEYIKFCKYCFNLGFATHVTKSACFCLSIPYAVFLGLYIVKWGYHIP